MRWEVYVVDAESMAYHVGSITRSICRHFEVRLLYLCVSPRGGRHYAMRCFLFTQILLVLTSSCNAASFAQRLANQVRSNVPHVSPSRDDLELGAYRSLGPGT